MIFYEIDLDKQQYKLHLLMHHIIGLSIYGILFGCRDTEGIIVGCDGNSFSICYGTSITK